MATGSLVNPLSASTSSLAPHQATQHPPPPEIEQTLSRLSAYRNVRGVMILSRRALPSSEQAQGGMMDISASRATNDPTSLSTGGAGIVQSTGSAFEGEAGRKYARVVEGIVEATAKGVEQCDGGDELKFMRIRTKRHELIITPDERYLLVVLQDPGS